MAVLTKKMVGMVASTLTIPSTPLAKESIVSHLQRKIQSACIQCRFNLPNRAAVVPGTPADEKISAA
jgi:hypothetical protein